jgi:hypothetical protein
MSHRKGIHGILQDLQGAVPPNFQPVRDAVEAVKRFMYRTGHERRLLRDKFAGVPDPMPDFDDLSQLIRELESWATHHQERRELDRVWRFSRVEARWRDAAGSPCSGVGAPRPERPTASEWRNALWDADDQLNAVLRELDRSRPARRTVTGQPEWAFGPGRFSYKGKEYELTGQPLRLLEAFVNAPNMTLTHEQIGDACAGGFGVPRVYAYVSELNAGLRRLKLGENIIQPIRGSKAYRLSPPL